MAQDGVVGPTPQKLHENYSAIRETLAKIATDCDEKPDTRRDAAALVGKLDTLETVMMGILWDRVLGRFKAVSVHLQKSYMDLATAVGLLQSLHSYVGTLRDQLLSWKNPLALSV